MENSSETFIEVGIKSVLGWAYILLLLFMLYLPEGIYSAISQPYNYIRIDSGKYNIFEK